MSETTEFSAADRDALIAERDRFKLAAEQAETAAASARKADDAAFCASMVTAGTLIPGAVADLVAVFGALDAGTIEFSAERKEPASAVLKKLLGGAKPVIQFGAIVSPDGQAIDQKDPAAITTAARALMATPAGAGLNFVAAVEAVSKGA